MMMKMTRRHLRDLILEVIDEGVDQPHVQSAGVIIIDGDSVLSLRAYQNWDFPKGRVEAGETLLDAAVRETEEETTLVAGEDYTLTGDQAPSITYSTGMKTKTATYFIATRASDKEPPTPLPVSYELDPPRPENDEWQWVPLAQLDNKDPEVGVVMPRRLAPVIEYVLSSPTQDDDDIIPSMTPEERALMVINFARQQGYTPREGMVGEIADIISAQYEDYDSVMNLFDVLADQEYLWDVEGDLLSEMRGYSRSEWTVIQALREMSDHRGLPVTHEVPADAIESVFRDRAVIGDGGIFFTLGHLKSQQFVTGEGYMIHGYIPHGDIHANMIHPDMRFTPQDDEHESAWGVMLSEARKRREGFYGLEISTNYERWPMFWWQAVIDNTSGEVEWDGGVP